MFLFKYLKFKNFKKKENRNFKDFVYYIHLEDYKSQKIKEKFQVELKKKFYFSS